MQQLAQEIRQFIVDNFLFGKSPPHLSDEDSFLEKGIIDSTGVLELVTFIEEKYEIKVEDEDLVPANLDSVRNVEAYVIRKVRSRSKPIAGRDVPGAECPSLSG